MKKLLFMTPLLKGIVYLCHRENLHIYELGMTECSRQNYGKISPFSSDPLIFVFFFLQALFNFLKTQKDLYLAVSLLGSLKRVRCVFFIYI